MSCSILFFNFPLIFLSSLLLLLPYLLIYYFSSFPSFCLHFIFLPSSLSMHLPPLPPLPAIYINLPLLFIPTLFSTIVSCLGFPFLPSPFSTHLPPLLPPPLFLYILIFHFSSSPPFFLLLFHVLVFPSSEVTFNWFRRARNI